MHILFNYVLSELCQAVPFYWIITAFLRCCPLGLGICKMSVPIPCIRYQCHNNAFISTLHGAGIIIACCWGQVFWLKSNLPVSKALCWFVNQIMLETIMLVVIGCKNRIIIFLQLKYRLKIGIVFLKFSIPGSIDSIWSIPRWYWFLIPSPTVHVFRFRETMFDRKYDVYLYVIWGVIESRGMLGSFPVICQQTGNLKATLSDLDFSLWP